MTITDRFKILRESCNKNQTEWAKILGLSRSGVSEIEAGRRSVTDKHIKLLCIEPIDGKMINETWLRTGDGEMFVPLTRNQEITDFLGNLIKEDDKSFKKRLINALCKLDQKDWDDVERLVEKLTKKRLGKIT